VAAARNNTSRCVAGWIPTITQMDPNDARCTPETFSANMSTLTIILNTATPCLSRRPLPSVAWVQSPTSACGICGGQTGCGTRFLPEYFYRVRCDDTSAPSPFIYYRRYLSPAIDTNIHNTKLSTQKLNYCAFRAIAYFLECLLVTGKDCSIHPST
jgi:hypothetical protein